MYGVHSGEFIWAFVILRFFFVYMYFSITGVKKIISCIKDFVIEVCYIKVPLYQESKSIKSKCV